MIQAIDQGLIYALLALGVFLTYRILNLADLTVDGSFTTGGGVAAILIYHGLNPYLATAAGVAAGALAGLVTALLHTKLKIDALLASILTMIALYSINLRIMGGPNVGLNLKGGETIVTVFTPLRARRLLGSPETALILLAVALVFAAVVVWFLSTNFGLAVQATGDNPTMALASGISTDWAKITTLMAANGLVGLSGALYAQFQGFADVGMGIGLILVGLASVIVGNAILGTRYMVLAALGVVLGSVIYRMVLFFAIDWELAEAGDMKLISAVMVVIALVFSQNAKLRAACAKISPFRSRPIPEPLTDPELAAPPAEGGLTELPVIPVISEPLTDLELAGRPAEGGSAGSSSAPVTQVLSASPPAGEPPVLGQGGNGAAEAGS
ncbi:MAG: ABC transporter permease [Bifidobacteriaceae bacterium]|nr:ABC transporter permease [Bifidobacteriaceae bacterium]